MTDSDDGTAMVLVRNWLAATPLKRLLSSDSGDFEWEEEEMSDDLRTFIHLFLEILFGQEEIPEIVEDALTNGILNTCLWEPLMRVLRFDPMILFPVSNDSSARKRQLVFSNEYEQDSTFDSMVCRPLTDLEDRMTALIQGSKEEEKQLTLITGQDLLLLAACANIGDNCEHCLELQSQMSDNMSLLLSRYLSDEFLSSVDHFPCMDDMCQRLFHLELYVTAIIKLMKSGYFPPLPASGRDIPDLDPCDERVQQWWLHFGVAMATLGDLSSSLCKAGDELLEPSCAKLKNASEEYLSCCIVNLPSSHTSRQKRCIIID